MKTIEISATTKEELQEEAKEYSLRFPSYKIIPYTIFDSAFLWVGKNIDQFIYFRSYDKKYWKNGVVYSFSSSVIIRCTKITVEK